MDKIIERLIVSNLDGAETITTTVTREDGTKAHYYIFKQENVNNSSTKHVEIPIWVYTKVNGKGKDSHFITVAISNYGYVIHDLNKEHTIKPLSTKTIGLPINEAEEVYEFPESVPLEESDIFDNLTISQIERCIKRLECELELKPTEEEINEPLPF